ncbi:MAG: hypothetical protein KAS57_09250 [Gammaproteobacteria bacterium]|nr:hypothetical protein [Gammaproteobacteria bacterium]
MNNKIKNISLWLILGPVLALLFSTISWYVIYQFSPDKLLNIEILFTKFPLGLFLSLMTPWGWLMYGGLLFMYSKKTNMSVSCTIIGALLFGGFWPIWSTFLTTV